MAVLNFDIKPQSLPTGGEAKAVFLTGSIDASTNHTFEQRLTDILSSGTKHLMLVLTNVKYINSTGLGTIVKCVDTFREKGGDIKLVGVPTKVIALFEMLGLLSLFETHETLDAAVASFGKGKGSAGAPATGGAKFPLQFKHPMTGMGLNVNQPGKFKDPRTGDYFSVDANGTVEFYEMAKIRMAEAKLPCDIDFAGPVVSLAKALAGRTSLPPGVSMGVQGAIEQAANLIKAKSEGSGETVTVLLVADAEKLQVGFLNHGTALTFEESEINGLHVGVDEVKHVALPSRGHLLTIVKKK